MLWKQIEKKLGIHNVLNNIYIALPQFDTTSFRYSHNSFGISWQKPPKHFKLLFSGTAYLHLQLQKGGGVQQERSPDNPAIQRQFSPVGVYGVRDIADAEDGTKRVGGGAVNTLGQVAGVLCVKDVGAAQPELGEPDLVLDQDGEVARSLQNSAS